ncbi:MAG TPA: hypothetical protein VFA81_04015 [Burkholderiales bacterium]|nr:hypothetical protein [Burkholderiales bacterium]
MSSAEQQRREKILTKAKSDPAWRHLTADAQRRLEDAIMNDRFPSLAPLA